MAKEKWYRRTGMKREDKPKDTEMLDEYDFSRGVRGKYAPRYAEGSNVVVLSPDAVEAFPDSASVNCALRSLIARNEVSHDPVGG
jgi:hypothetical protein